MKLKLTFILSLCVITFSLAMGAWGYSAKSVCLFDTETREVVFGYNEEVAMEPASITKILTAITALTLGNNDDIVTVSKRAAGTEGSSLYLKEGEQFKLKDLIYGLMLHSGNDAANAIADHFGYDDFIKEMNETAELTGAQNFHFENPSGLPDKDHYVSALDMARITAYALHNPDFSEIAATKEKSISSLEGKERHLRNHNKLLWRYENTIGVKTGFTKSAGRTLVSAATCDERTLVCVTMNAPDDWNDHISLYKKFLE